MTGSPTARRRRLAIELKKLRDESTLTCNQVGEKLDWSGSKVNRMETGLGRVQPSDVDALCRLYGTTEEMRDLLKSLAKDSKTKGWWHAHGDAVPGWFSVYVGLEQAAVDLRTYQGNSCPAYCRRRSTRQSSVVRLPIKPRTRSNASSMCACGVRSCCATSPRPGYGRSSTKALSCMSSAIGR